MNKVVSFFLGLLLAGAAQAQGGGPSGCTTLVYVGAPLKGSITAPVVGTISLGVPLGANLVNWSVATESANCATLNCNFLAWDFTPVALSLFWTYGNGPPEWVPSITFSTDANGNITDWSFTLLIGHEFGCGIAGCSGSIMSTPAGDSVAFSAPEPFLPATSGTNSVAGKWMCLGALAAPDPLTALVAKLRAQLAAVTYERDEYVAWARAVDAELLALEKRK